MKLLPVQKTSARRMRSLVKNQFVHVILSACLTCILLISSCQPNLVQIPEQYVNGHGMTFQKIDTGTFWMGSTWTASQVSMMFGGDSIWFANEHPRHKVTLTKSILIGKHEVTKRAFRDFVKSTSYKTDVEKSHNAEVWVGKERKVSADATWETPGHVQSDNHPVVCITWHDAMEFVSWLNKTDHALPSGLVYDLPTEAEWEYSCKAGANGEYLWGDDPKEGKGWGNFADSSGMETHGWDLFFPFNDGYAESAPVGTFKPNAFGLYDMVGNVYEWTKDTGKENANFYQMPETKNPINTSDDNTHMLRGGSWHSNQRGIRSAKRKAYSNSTAGDNIGFRVVLRESQH